MDSNQTSFPLLGLPNELIVKVAKEAGKNHPNDLTCLMRTNRYLYTLLQFPLQQLAAVSTAILPRRARRGKLSYQVNPRKRISVRPFLRVTVLGWAVIKNRLALITGLLDRGVDVDGRVAREYHDTALTVAIHTNNTGLVRLLLARGASISKACVGDVYSPLTEPTLRGNTEMIKLFLDAGVDVNRAGKHSPSDRSSGAHCGFHAVPALHAAVIGIHDWRSYRNEEGLPRVPGADAEGGSTFYTDVQVAVIKFLLANGADPNIRTRMGTALHQAVASCYINGGQEWDACDVIQALLEGGADPDMAKTAHAHDVYTPQDMAEGFELWMVYMFLRRWPRTLG